MITSMTGMKMCIRDRDDLVTIHDIGLITAQSVVAFFKEEKNLHLIEVLKQAGCNLDVYKRQACI